MSDTESVEVVALAASDSATGTGSPGGVGNTNLPATTASPAFATDAPTAAWEGILVVEGVTTGDGREFSAGSLTWPDPGSALLPISWQKQAIGGHDGSVIVARIDQMWRDPANPAMIRASGVFDLGSPEGQEAYRQVKDGFLRGVSVDVDSVKDSDVELVYPPMTDADGVPLSEDMADDDLMMLFGPPPEKTIFHAGRVRGATLVALPAFVEAQIALVDKQPSLVASAGFVCREMNKMVPHLRRDGEFDVAMGARQIGIVLSSAASKLSLTSRQMIHAHLATHLRALGLTPQPFSIESLSDEVRESLVASANVEVARPPSEWFSDPNLGGVPGLHIDEPNEFGLQRVWGYAAHFGTCHIGYPGACNTAPFEDRHDYFLQGEVLTSDGKYIPIGSITLGTGHANLQASVRETQAHYDNTGSAVADVACGNDEHGIWVAGYIRLGVAPAKVVELRAAKLSGDWRRVSGRLRLVALLAVNVPGFPQTNTSIRMSHGVQLSLVAAGLEQEVTASVEHSADQEAIRRMKNKLAMSIGRDAASRKAELRARVH